MIKIFAKLKQICILMLLFVFTLTGLSDVALAMNQEAFLAGGCFWCLEHDLESYQGVLSVESGYTGGASLNPTYRQHAGHQEAVRVVFDSDEISYADLLRGYWRNIDPFDGQGQFCDRGDSYRPVIFTANDVQVEEVDKSFVAAGLELGELRKQFKIKVKPLIKFWIAEDYHQDFAENNSLKYSFYRYNCGRDRRLEQIWGENSTTLKPWANQEGQI